LKNKRERVGFIGLGIMGRRMAQNLIKNGYQLIVHNRSRKSLLEFSKVAKIASSPREVAENSDIVIDMLPMLLTSKRC
jgi:2-hydroxy-3-oxopropionate reductase